jgi:hypothetical protein
MTYQKFNKEIQIFNKEIFLIIVYEILDDIRLRREFAREQNGIYKDTI